MWKGLLLALNQALDKRSVDLLLFLRKTEGNNIEYSGDGLLQFAGLISSGLVEIELGSHYAMTPAAFGQHAGVDTMYHPVPHSPRMFSLVRLSDRGSSLLDAWLEGDESKFVELVSVSNKSTGEPSPDAG